MEIPYYIRNKMFPKPLAPGLCKKSTEYAVLAVLKHCERELFRFLHHADVPDLQDEVNGIGIEVTEAITRSHAQVNGEFTKLSQSDDPDEKEKSRKIIRQNGVNLVEDFLMVFPAFSPADEKSTILNAFQSKLDKAGIYRRKGFASVGLLIYVEAPILDDTRFNGYGWFTSAQADRKEKYDFVYLCYRDGLIRFVFQKKKCKEFFIPKNDMAGLQNLGRMAAEGEIKDDDPIWTS